MSAITLDTLDYVNKLKAGGFTEQQAETQARALAEVVEKQLATKQDMDNHEANLRRDIEVLRADLKKDIAETKAELIRWVVGVGVLQTTLSCWNSRTFGESDLNFEPERSTGYTNSV